MGGFGRPNLISVTAVMGLMAWLALQAGPLMIGGTVQWVPATLWGIACLSGFTLLSELLDGLANVSDLMASRHATGKSGTALWAKRKDLRKEGRKRSGAPFWGRLAGTFASLFVDFASNAMCVAPAGSGKGIYTVIPALFAIKSSKVVADFKGELACVMSTYLRDRGELVILLNPGGLFSDSLGKGDSYNPLDLIAGDLYRAGGLRDVPDDLREMSAQLLPEPKEAGENAYFREGARRAIALAMLIEVMLEGYDATMATVAVLLEDRVKMERHLRWLTGVDLAGKPLPEGPMPIAATEWAQYHDAADLEEFILLIRAQASNTLALMTGSDSRTWDSFVSGAQQAVAPFAFGRLAPAMRRSTFKMSDLKDKIATLFIISDASRPKAYEPWIGLVQWCAMTELKRHPKKDVPVYFILDEVTNYVVNGLASLLTWGRSYGLRLLIVFQDLAAFRKTYGEEALETLLSETEIKLFLPGQRSPGTLERIKKMLGEQSVVSLSSGQAGLSERARDTASESGRPLMTEDELRRTEKAILFVRKAPPVLVEPVSYAEVHPWRKQAGINPFHGKPFLKRTKVWLFGDRA